MNTVNNVKMKENSININGFQNKNNYANLGKKGQVIIGTITDVSKKVKLDFGGMELSVSKDSMKEPKVGEERAFEIQEVSPQSIVLKEITQSGVGNVEAKMMVRTMVGNSRADFVDILEKSNMSDGNSIKGLGEDKEKVTERMTGNDMKTIEESGMSLEKYKMTETDRILTRIKKQRMEKEEGIASFQEKQGEKKQAIQKISNRQLVDKQPSNVQIANLLEQKNLPVTEGNIETISSAIEKAQVAPNLSEDGMKYLLDQQLEPTIGNVYRAQYAGSSSKYENYSGVGAGYQTATVVYDGNMVEKMPQDADNAWTEIEPQVETIIEEAGLSVNEETLNQAKWLFNHNLPITREMLYDLDDIRIVKENYDTETMLNRITDSFALGEDVESVSLVIRDMDDTKKSIDAFLGELEENYQQVLTNNPQKQTELEQLTRKRQLEEIRMKMTVSCATQLQKNGITLDINHLEEIVDGLKDMERSFMKVLLEEGGAVVNEENIDLLAATNDTIEQLKNVPMYVLGTTLEYRASITVSQLHEEGVSLQTKLSKAEMAYETLMTKPDKLLGDSIQKAFQNVPVILDDLNMDDSEANIRAVKILAHNQMNITKENIFKVKEYDAEVNQLLSDMHPAVVVELIKRGINPLEQTINQLDETVRNIRDELGISEDEKYSRFLYKLEQKKEISEEDRQTFINIYRLLNNIQKLDGAAVGYVLQTDSEMNLENLQTAVKTLRGKGVKEKVTDDASDKKITYSRGMLLSQVNDAFSKEDAERIYYDRIVEALGEEITPSILEKLQEENGQVDVWKNLYKENIEKMLEHAKNVEDEEGEDTQYEEMFLKNFREQSDNSSRMISYLESKGIETTIENIMAAGQLTEVYDTLKKQTKKLEEDKEQPIDQLMEGLSDTLDEPETLQQQVSLLEEEAEKLMDARLEADDITSMEIRELKLVCTQTKLLRKLANKQDYYVPVMTGEKMTNIHLTIVSGVESQGKVQIAYSSERYGNVSAQFTMTEKKLQGSVQCTSVKAADDIKAQKADFEEKIQAQGMELEQITYNVTGHSMEAFVQQDEQETDVRGLYQVAKAFVQHVSYLEQIPVA